MNKQCTKCGAQVPVESNFCQACGGSEFFVNEAQQPAFAEQPVQQAWQPPMPQPKKKKTGLIIGIVAGALVVLAVIGMVAEKVFQNMGYGDSDDIDSDYVFDLGGDTDEEDTTPAVSYTKGTFNGVTYENKWADMKLVLPTGFSNADASTYATAENESTECGFYFVADDSTGLIYAYFEKLPTFPVYDEEEYMDAVMDTLAGISNFTTTDVYTTIVIGDYTYRELLISARVEVGASTLWSESESIRTLDNLFGRDVISAVQYLKRLPRGTVPDVSGLIRELEQPALPSAEGVVQGLDEHSRAVYNKLPEERRAALLREAMGGAV